MLPRDRSHALVAAEVIQAQRLAAAQHQSRSRAVHRQHQAEGVGGTLAHGMLDHQPRGVAGRQRQNHQVGAGHLQRMDGHQGQHVIGIRIREQPLRDLGAGPKPLLLPLGLLVQPRVPYRHAGRGTERGQDGLVLLVELGSVPLLGQVQIAVDLVPDPHRSAEEGLHRGMPLGEPVRSRMGGHIGQPQRLRVGDQLAEQAPALGPVVNLLDLLLVQAHRDELGQRAAFADDPERAVPGIDERDRGLDDLPQHDLELEVAADRDDRLEQRVHPVPRLDRSRKPDLQFRQQVIEAQLGQQRPALIRLHAASNGLRSTSYLILRRRRCPYIGCKAQVRRTSAEVRKPTVPARRGGR